MLCLIAPLCKQVLNKFTLLLDHGTSRSERWRIGVPPHWLCATSPCPLHQCQPLIFFLVPSLGTHECEVLDDGEKRNAMVRHDVQSFWKLSITMPNHTL